MAKKFFDFLITLIMLYLIAVILSFPIVREIVFIIVAGVIGIALFIYGLKEFFNIKLIKGCFIMICGAAIIRGLLIVYELWFGK